MLTLVALMSNPASAADLMIPADRDSTVGESSTQRGWSGYDHVLLGRRAHTAGHERRPILDFDLSSIPSSSDITGAELTVQINQVAGNPVDFTVHAVTGDWVEGTEVPGNDLGTGTVGVSWNRRQSGVNWTAGGRFSSTIIGSGTMSSVGSATFDLDASAISDMRDNPATSTGIILVPNGAAPGDLVRFNSREGAGAATLDITLDGPIDNLDVVVADLADLINSGKPGFISESAPVRARPSTIVNSLRDAVNGLIESGCMSPAASANLSSYAGGFYASGDVFGFHATGAEGGVVDASLSVSPNTFQGTFEDAGGLGVDHTFGDFESGFADLRLAADYEFGSGFVFGLGIRERGTKGAFMTIHGVCDGPGDFGPTLNQWVGAPVFSLLPPT